MPSRKKRKVEGNFTHKSHVSFWGNLKRKSVYESVKENKYRTLLINRRTQRENKFKHFSKTFKVKKVAGAPQSTFQGNLKSLKHWVKYASWNFCSKCYLLYKNTLLPRSFNSKGARCIPTNKCWCTKNKYVIPSYKRIPKPLRGLTQADENILSVSQIDIGSRKIAAAGHRIKNGAFELAFREYSVDERIKMCTNANQKHRLQKALAYLADSEQSMYKEYLKKQCKYTSGTKIKIWTVYKNLVGIECALWPVLYPFTYWCESTLKEGREHSVLHSFRCKLLCNIIDYNNNFALLQYQYDRWLFKTISGAVNSGKFRNASPYKALEHISQPGIGYGSTAF